MDYPRGIRPHGDGIQITFSWLGSRYRPTWPQKPNKRNLEAASRLRTEITRRAKLGVLTYQFLSEHFPQYIKPETVRARSPLFSEMAQTYLNLADVSPNTRNEYRKALMAYWQPEFAAVPVDEITTADIRRALGAIEWRSNKTRNNALIPLRGVLDLCVQDELIQVNPADRIKNLKHQKPEIDPFTAEESELILAELYRRYTGEQEIYAIYFELAFWTGLRTSELIALRWDDVDWRAGTINITKAQSKGRLNATTKTRTSREVLLNDRSMAALKKAKALTYLQGQQVIVSPATGRGWISDKAPRVILTRTLRKLGIRHRPAYNTRHSYATRCIMAGMNVAFIAQQLGHSVQMLLSTYGKWIHGEASRAEMSKLTQNATNAPHAETGNY